MGQNALSWALCQLLSVHETQDYSYEPLPSQKRNPGSPNRKVDSSERLKMREISSSFSEVLIILGSTSGLISQNLWTSLPTIGCRLFQDSKPASVIQKMFGLIPKSCSKISERVFSSDPAYVKNKYFLEFKQLLDKKNQKQSQNSSVAPSLVSHKIRKSSRAAKAQSSRPSRASHATQRPSARIPISKPHSSRLLKLMRK